jgi:hypothetical protein
MVWHRKLLTVLEDTAVRNVDALALVGDDYIDGHVSLIYTILMIISMYR